MELVIYFKVYFKTICRWNQNGNEMKAMELINGAWSLCPPFFIKFLFFTKWLPLKNYQKCFLFHLKSSFHSWDIHIFLFSSSPLFFPVSHCFKGWSKKNLKIHYVISCLNKNLISHFVWYLEKEISCDIETFSIDRELNKEHFKQKSCRKCAPKASSRPLLNFAK